MFQTTHHRHLSLTTPTTLVGRTSENLTAWFLKNHNYYLVDRNYNTASGEIDIIALKTTGRFVHVHFVEVKSRSVNIPWSLRKHNRVDAQYMAFSGSHHAARCRRPIAPESAVSKKKQTKIYNAARSWIATQKIDQAVFHFDVAAVTLFTGSSPRIKYIHDAYYPHQQFGW